MKPLAKTQVEAFIGEALPIIFEGDWDAMKLWMKRHAKTLRQSTIREVRANTVLMASLKMLYGFTDSLTMLRTQALPDLQGEVAKMERQLANWRHAIHLLVETWPKQINIGDFKGTDAPDDGGRCKRRAACPGVSYRRRRHQFTRLLWDALRYMRLSLLGQRIVLPQF